MTVTAREVFDHLFSRIDHQPSPGTLQILQRAVLSKALVSLERDGRFPVTDFPLSLHRVLGGDTHAGLAAVGACLLFYAFADVTDDAQDHDLSDEPWHAWGWEQAINTGTALLFQSLKLVFDSLPGDAGARAASVFVQAGLEMTFGQHTDLIGQAAELSFAEYVLAAERKSGASFGAYAQVVAIANGLPDERALAFRDFGRALGVLFQMINDTYELWAPGLSPDFANRRLSLPLVLALEHVQGQPLQQLQEILDGPLDEASQQRLVSLLERAGIKGYATMRIEVYRRRARELARTIGAEEDPYLAELLRIPAFPVANVAI